jgi:glycosyltransferase involved in cell wall biosynthesis
MEKSCCELADFLISPSSYLLDWMRGHAWALPDISRCIPNFVSSPGNGRPAMPRQHLAGPGIREIVFFGRLEERKGVRIFCDAIAMLPERLLSGRTITFLGKEDHFRADDLRSRLTPLLDKAGATLLFFTGYDSVEAREYLRREGVLAVMPSLRENSPCTVSECLESGVPFIASSRGGGKELILEEDREAAIFIPQKECLAERLRAVLESEGITAARPSWAVKDIFRDWQAILEDAARHRH